MATTIPATEIPDNKSLKTALKLEVLDVEGKKVSFGSIVEGQKTIVVFIRTLFHSPLMYVEALAEVPAPALQTAGAKLVVIGCGEWNPIQSYGETTGFPASQIYADPTRALYRALGMNIEKLEGTPKGEQRKSYLTKSMFVNAVQSVWRGPLKNPSLIGKQGNISQLGGDFVFGPDLEVKDLLKVAGVEVVAS
ncbi:hypothetical protein DXG03_003017 [Asterophora parasitica]|uniref:Uncharacterized protein n=1 Tax=Asterophora parasitica TaxID=117018 RepID=A0A9P7KAW7_9AGAR|nr:hypothetical protein DXG03_003017 [Asterophora parasitica]